MSSWAFLGKTMIPSSEVVSLQPSDRPQAQPHSVCKPVTVRGSHKLQTTDCCRTMKLRYLFIWFSPWYCNASSL